MSDDIKEILDILKTDMIHIRLVKEDREKILDCITNLQEEVENLREEDWAWHQILKMQNKREYRSKFLKDFQKEYGTNTYPDYDEIYKRYDKMKSRIDKVSNKIKTIFKEENWYENYEYNDLEKALKEIDYILQGSDKE